LFFPNKNIPVGKRLFRLTKLLNRLFHFASAVATLSASIASFLNTFPGIRRLK
jgi:hypothetical protein